MSSLRGFFAYRVRGTCFESALIQILITLYVGSVLLQNFAWFPSMGSGASKQQGEKGVDEEKETGASTPQWNAAALDVRPRAL